MKHLAAIICFALALICYLLASVPAAIGFGALGAMLELAGYITLYRTHRRGKRERALLASRRTSSQAAP